MVIYVNNLMARQIFKIVISCIVRKSVINLRCQKELDFRLKN